MSCGQLALQRLGIKVDKYYASEIDKHAIAITQKNFPNTIQIGDVTKVDAKDFMDVDLMLAGSPCQGFSFAGKKLAFDDPRSALFFEFVRLLKAIKPKYFLLENVRMEPQHLGVITDQVSECYTSDEVDREFLDLFNTVRFEPHFINSSLVSAQSRQRFYWTNIPNIKQPQDKNIVLRDILEEEPNDPTLMSDNFVKRQIKNNKDSCLITSDKEKASNLSASEYVKNGRQGDYLACDEQGRPICDLVGNLGKTLLKADVQKAGAVLARDGNGWNNWGMVGVRKPMQVGEADIKGHDMIKRVYSPDGKSPTLTTMGGGNTEPKVAYKTPMKAFDIPEEILKDNERNRRVYDETGKAPTIMTHTPPKITGGAVRGRYNEEGTTSQQLELRADQKSNALTTVQKDSVLIQQEEQGQMIEGLSWRKLTPLECERLQTVPDGYTEGASKTQRYRMLGNGWTIDVIAHIFSYMDKEVINE